MADLKISQLTESTSIQDTDLFEISQDAGGSYNSRKITFANTRKGISILGSSDTDNITIDVTGHLTLNGEAVVWDDLMIPGLGVGIGGSAPDLIPFGTSGNLMIYGFDGTNTLEQVYFTVQMSHTWKLNTPLHPHIHWTPTTAGSGVIKWFLDYSFCPIGLVFPAPTTTTILETVTAGSAWKHYLTEFPEIATANSTISSMLACRLYRDPNDVQDTYGSDAAFLQFDIHYMINSLGSREELVK